MEPIHLHERPALLYSLGLLLLGGQLMSIGFLAELFIAYHAPDIHRLLDLGTDTPPRHEAESRGQRPPQRSAVDADHPTAANSAAACTCC